MRKRVTRIYSKNKTESLFRATKINALLEVLI